MRARLLSCCALVASLAVPASAERGADGELRIIFSQAPSILNPYLSGGGKDVTAASIVLEPLARLDRSGAMVPYLAEEIPTLANGGVSEDLTGITWRLKQGLNWSDGTPVTAEDVVFTAEYCMHPAMGCAQLTKFKDVSAVEALDARTVRVTFASPKPNPYGPFVGEQSPILQKAQFAGCLGEAAPTCTGANFQPVGTGAFKVDEFLPNDSIMFSANDSYRQEDKPAFGKIFFKGGGDVMSAARSVFQTGEFDYAWNLQLAPDIVDELTANGKGEIVAAFGALVERIEVNLTDPSPDLADGVRSTRAAPHPILSDKAVRQALSMAIDRALLVEIGYGAAGRPTCNLVPAPALYASTANESCKTQDIEGARALLDAAGWVPGADGVRVKDGKRLVLDFSSSTNAVRQDFQSLIKQWWSEIGIDANLRNINPSVFFGGDPGSPDTFQRFYSDVEMYANFFVGTDPEAYMNRYRCGGEPRPETQWQGENIMRFCDPEYDLLLDELAQTGDLEKRGELVRRLNDILIQSYSLIPLVDRGRVSGRASSLGGVVMNSWDSELWNIADWYRIE